MYYFYASYNPKGFYIRAKIKCIYIYRGIEGYYLFGRKDYYFDIKEVLKKEVVI